MSNNSALLAGLPAGYLEGARIDDAIREKFHAGREKYGKEWSGAHPLLEAAAESLDLCAYLRVARESGEIGRDDLASIEQHALSCAVLIQELILSLPEGGLELGSCERSHLTACGLRRSGARWSEVQTAEEQPWRK